VQGFFRLYQVFRFFLEVLLSCNYCKKKQKHTMAADYVYCRCSKAKAAL